MIVKTGANYQNEGGYIEASRSGSNYYLSDGEIETSVVGIDNSTQKAYAAHTITIFNATSGWISFPVILNGVLQYGSHVSIDSNRQKTFETPLSKDTAIEMVGIGIVGATLHASDPAITIRPLGPDGSFIFEMTGELTGDVITITRD